MTTYLFLKTVEVLRLSAFCPALANEGRNEWKEMMACLCHLPKTILPWTYWS